MPYRRAEDKIKYPRTVQMDGGFVTDWVARLRLFGLFQRIYQVHGKTANGLNATVFAVIMVAPMAQMREMLERIRRYRPSQHGPENPVNLLLFAMYTAPEAVRSCIPNRRPAMSTASTRDQPAQPPTNPFLRNIPSAPEKRREQDVCLFTVSRDAEKADIFPLCTTIGDAFQPLDALLLCFWGERIRDRWASQVADPRITESARNFLSMSRQLHFWWDNAAFALKPLSETATEIVVEWHWLQESCLTPRKLIPPDADYAKYVCRHVCDSWGSMKHAFGKTLQTGQAFTIRVEDPGQLPSFELLELQWDLLRVAAISGAANFDAKDPFSDAEESKDFA
ncbi:hypothetical protein J3F83DRAFT_767287 [Trichoderma novae-zelandiae]